MTQTDCNGVRSQYDYDVLGRQLRDVFTKGTTSLGTAEWFWDKNSTRADASDARFGALSTTRSIYGHTPNVDTTLAATTRALVAA